MMDEQEQTEQMSPSSSKEYDVAILGGGIAGLTLALQIKKARPNTSMLVIDKQEHPVPEAAHKVGESTVEIAAHYLRNMLDLGEHLQTQQLPKYGLRMFFSVEDNRDITHRVELGHSVLPPRPVATYQLDRGRLENTLGEELHKHGIPFLDGYKIQHVTLQPEEEFHRVSIQHVGGDQEVRARWIVDASGRNTLLQRQLGLAKKVEHNANAVWFRVGHAIDVNEWSTDEQWRGRIKEGRRALSTNHLMGPGYWIWIIPLSSGSTSVGIVTDARIHNFDEMNLFDRALTWLHAHEPQCAKEIEQHTDRIQDFRVMKNYSYSCEQVFSEERWCLTGEAGVSLDPLYSPGGDLIAIANGLVSDLIIHALDGEDIEERAAVHNNLFLLFTGSWLSTYKDQYPIMGNAQIMIAKVIWDTAVYWALPGLLYFHDSFRQVIDSPAILTALLRFSILSEHIQKFLSDWLAIAPHKAMDMFIRYYDFDFMERLHIGMTKELTIAELEKQLVSNVHFLDRLGGQLVRTVMALFTQSSNSPTIESQLQHWRDDTFLQELITLYEREEQEHPINSSWITLGHRAIVGQKLAG